MDKNLEQQIADILKDKPFTMPIIYNKPYSENYISDWLAFILNPEINGLGNEPLNILLSLAGQGKIKDNEYVDFSKPREIQLDNKSRIDFLIPVYKNRKAKEDNQNPLYYIAIENKTFSAEGNKQTDRYFEKIESKIKQNNSNVYIFFTAVNKTENENFSNVLYKDFVDELKKIDVSNIQAKCRVYINAFIEHIETYILSDDKLFSENDCKLLNIGGEIEDAYKSSNSHERTCEPLHEAHFRLVSLKNTFFRHIKDRLEAAGYTQGLEINIGECYIQVYNNGWQQYNIHYEILLAKRKAVRGGIYDGCNLSVMIHAEKRKNHRDTLRERLCPILEKSFDENKGFDINESNLDKSKENWRVYEEKIDTFNCFNSPDAYEKFIKDLVDKLNDLVGKTKSDIDKYVNSLNENK